jgi:demethylmenaquinone methyltransferase/2-methoxy-6-polyprenyl-1,4-benzoquinol methylase
MPHEKKDPSVRDIFSIVAPYIDPLDTAFSLGLCHLWRRRLVSGIARGEKVLDLCTGTGEVAGLLLRKIGREGSLTCLDFCEDMLEVAKRKLTPLPSNMTFVVSDVREMSFSENTFDAATVAFGMRNVPDTPLALKRIQKVLKPGGRFLCLELTKPTKRWLLPLYRWYTFTFMPAVAGIITKSEVPYTYLPRSIEAFYPLEEFKRRMTECGFTEVKDQSLSLGIATLYSAVKSR